MFRACGRGGAMHPKGTCSASLHCVGIAPYGGTQGDAVVSGGGVYPKGTCSASLHCVVTPPYGRSSVALFVGRDDLIAPHVCPLSDAEGAFSCLESKMRTTKTGADVV